MTPQDRPPEETSEDASAVELPVDQLAAAQFEAVQQEVDAAGSGLPDAWKVHLPIFEGPLDLLLHLIKVNKVDIYDIPVLQICDQFHQYLQLMEDLNLDIAGEFIYEAAMLVRLKSKLLLPLMKNEDGEAEEDPREELVQRLLEYRRLKEAAQSLAEVSLLRRGLWTRQAPPPKLVDESDESVDLGELSLFDLLSAFKTAMDRFHRENPPPIHLRGETFSVKDQFHRLLGKLRPEKPFDVLDDLRLCSCRAEAIASFLAILELARLSLIRVHQTDDGEVLLYRTTRELESEHLESIQG